MGLVLGAGGALSAMGQETGATVQFSLDRPGPPVVQYTVSVGEDGAGTFTPRPAPGSATVGESKTIHVSAPVLKKIFAAVPMVEGGRCETHNKGIAKTGVKVLHYAGAGKDAQCEYNYSDDERVNDATTAFEGIAETLLFGDRLAAKLRFDRLGLDNELDDLGSAVKDGRALEVENIAPVLKKVSEDERAMDRVRRKAERLLQDAETGQAAVGNGPSAR